jgi:molybdenum cofactor cytidylyltransferase
MSRVGCALLAPGISRRRGRPKQLAAWRENELVRHLAMQALSSRADEVAVVVGAHAEQVAPLVRDLSLRCIVNLEWREGVASSIRCATHWAQQVRLDALILVTSEEPHLDAQHIDQLIAEHAAGATHVASRYGGALGVPALFAANAFRSLFLLSGDNGAAALLRNRADTRAVEWPAGVADIDTARDVVRLDAPAASVAAIFPSAPFPLGPPGADRFAGNVERPGDP